MDPGWGGGEFPTGGAGPLPPAGAGAAESVGAMVVPFDFDTDSSPFGSL